MSLSQHELFPPLFYRETISIFSAEEPCNQHTLSSTLYSVFLCLLYITLQSFINNDHNHHTIGLFGSTALYHCALCAGKECYQHSSGQHQRAVPLSPTFLGALLKPRLRTLLRCLLFSPSQCVLADLLPCILIISTIHSTTLVYTNLTVAHHTNTHKGTIQSWGCHTPCVCVCEPITTIT